MSCSCRCRRSGTTVAAGDSFSEVESTKSVSDIYAPVSGVVVAVNEALADDPARSTATPTATAGSARSSLSRRTQLEALLDADGYRALIEG